MQRALQLKLPVAGGARNVWHFLSDLPLPFPRRRNRARLFALLVFALCVYFLFNLRTSHTSHNYESQHDGRHNPNNPFPHEPLRSAAGKSLASDELISHVPLDWSKQRTLNLHDGSRVFTEDEVARFEKEVSAREAKIISGFGDNGKGVEFSGDEKKVADEIAKKAAFNLYASDRIALNRSVPDVRRDE
jgi:cell division protein FtsI/penicillin-binding protein 2